MRIRGFQKGDGSLVAAMEKNSRRPRAVKYKIEMVEKCSCCDALIAEENGKPVGYVAFQDMDGAHYVMQIKVVGGEREKGVASALMGEMERVIESGRININVDVGNKAAIGLYKKMGYLESGSQTNYRDGQDKLWMTKKLGE